MDKELIESMKTKSREERAAFFKEHKSELLSDDLAKVNGGSNTGRNPNSDVPDDRGNWWTSFGFACGTNWC